MRRRNSWPEALRLPLRRGAAVSAAKSGGPPPPGEGDKRQSAPRQCAPRGPPPGEGDKIIAEPLGSTRSGLRNAFAGLPCEHPPSSSEPRASHPRGAAWQGSATLRRTSARPEVRGPFYGAAPPTGRRYAGMAAQCRAVALALAMLGLVGIVSDLSVKQLTGLRHL